MFVFVQPGPGRSGLDDTSQFRISFGGCIGSDPAGLEWIG
jgi:hypothetical protein